MTPENLMSSYINFKDRIDLKIKSKVTSDFSISFAEYGIQYIFKLIGFCLNKRHARFLFIPTFFVKQLFSLKPLKSLSMEVEASSLFTLRSYVGKKTNPLTRHCR